MTQTVTAGTRSAASCGLDPDTAQLASEALFALLAVAEQPPDRQPPG